MANVGTTSNFCWTYCCAVYLVPGSYCCVAPHPWSYDTLMSVRMPVTKTLCCHFSHMFHTFKTTTKVLRISLVVFRLFLTSPSSLFFSLPCFPWWRIMLFCYFVSALHPPRALLTSLKYAWCLLSWVVDVDLLFDLFFFSFRFSISIWTSLVPYCLVGTTHMLSWRFRFLVRLV